MPRANGHRFTIYDKLEADGVFAANPANSYARGENGENLFLGPVEFPKMLYHPEGEEHIVVPGEIMSTPLGASRVGEQRELIHKIVKDAAELKTALAAGWHDHPVKSNQARIEGQIEAGTITEAQGKKLLDNLPTITTVADVKKLEAEIASLQSQLKQKAS